ncbi:MAG: hypothetical protein MUD14_24045 [Hydrococcus sp. Prado102]|jgi:hypothetical protein|nr:hypothetical protein [Hydrococcus sp. Prado102]
MTMNLSDRDKFSYFKNLAVIAIKNIHDLNKELLGYYANKLEISKTELEAISPDELLNYEFQRLENNNFNLELLCDAVTIVCSKGEGNVDENQYQACVELAGILNYNQNTVDRTIENFFEISRKRNQQAN